MRATDGYGVDMILSSLTGDLLDGSWRYDAWHHGQSRNEGHA